MRGACSANPPDAAPPALVRASSGLRIRLRGAAATVLLSLYACLSSGCRQAAAGTQPIAFNHKVHAEQSVDCTTCHEGAERGERAGLPGKEVCMVCHQVAVGATAEEARLRALAEQGDELQWSRLTALPDHVYFSHRRHTSAGKIECSSCHGEMEKATRPQLRAMHFSMRRCERCHAAHPEREGAARATLDCASCHR